MSLRLTLNRSLQKLEKPYDTYNEITISRSALLHNFDLLCSLVTSGFVFPVLKSNAYGHGLCEVSTMLKDRKFPYIAVDGFYESLQVHSISRQPVLVMGAIKPDNFKRIDFKRTAFVVHDKKTVKALGATKREVKIHVEIDTGMTRHGVALNELPTFLGLLKDYPNIQVEGVMTHLADADNSVSDAFTVWQTQLFDEHVQAVLKAGFKPKYFHIAQSAGSAKITSRYANAIRPGIALYGINPLETKDKARKKFIGLRPVLSLHSTVSKVISIKAGTTVSYGRTYTPKQDAKIGVLPLGYYEGFDRRLSNVGVVGWKGIYLQVAGRINMNHTMIDLKDSELEVGDRVTLISGDKNSRVSADNICQKHGIFIYELLVGLNQNIRRKIIA